jgi:flavin-dependent dehydrogenase
VTDQVELDLVASGYVGLARQADGSVNVCALTTQGTVQRWGPNLDNVLRHLVAENPVLQEHLAQAARAGHWLAVGPVRMGIRELAQGGAFYIGDAACVVDPFAGEGMAMGLYSSRLLARALESPSPSDMYARLWRRSFVPALRWNALVRMAYRLRLVREPLVKTLRAFPQSLNWLMDLTRYERIA